MNRTTPEGALMKAVTDLLDCKKILYFRMNAGDRFGETNGKKWRIKGHRPGTADVLALPLVKHTRKCDGVYPSIWLWRHDPLFLELKSPTGRQTPEQKEFQEDVEARGMTYLLIRDVDELIQWMKERGL